MQNNSGQGMGGPNGAGGAGNGQQMTPQQYQARLIQQQHYQAMQAAARIQQQQQQQTSSPAPQNAQRPMMPQQQQQQQQPQQSAMGGVTQQQMQALQQLFQNNPEQLAQFVNMTKEGRVSQEQLQQLRQVMAAAQSQRTQQQNQQHVQQPNQQQMRPQQVPQQHQQLQQNQQQGHASPARPQGTPQQASAPTPRPHAQQIVPQQGTPQQRPMPGPSQQQAGPSRPQGQPGQGQQQQAPNPQAMMARIQQVAEPIVRRIKEIEAAFTAGNPAPGTPDRAKLEAEYTSKKDQQRKLGEQFMMTKAQLLHQQGNIEQSNQLVARIREQQKAAAAAAAAASPSGPATAPGQAPGASQGQMPPQLAAAAQAQAQNAQATGQAGQAGKNQSATSSASQGQGTPQQRIGSAASQSSAPTLGAKRDSMSDSTALQPVAIPAQLDVAPSSPEAYPNASGPRPTLNHGLGTNPILGTPAILERPDPAPTASGSAAGGGPASASNTSSWEALLGVPSREGKPGALAADRGAASTEDMANEMGNPDFWDSLTGKGTGAESLVNTGSASTATAPGAAAMMGAGDGRLLTKRKVQELVGEIDANERLEGDVEDLLLEIADEFIDSVTDFACRLAKHRKGDRLEVRDVQLVLERNWNLRIPTPGSVPIPPPRIKAAQGGAAATASKATS